METLARFEALELLLDSLNPSDLILQITIGFPFAHTPRTRSVLVDLGQRKLFCFRVAPLYGFHSGINEFVGRNPPPLPQIPLLHEEGKLFVVSESVRGCDQHWLGP
jgi:hypothetical protein